MRKIKTAEDAARIERRNKFVGGLIVIVLLTISSLGYSFMSADGGGSSDRVEEMGLVFYKTGGLWATEVAGEVFYFSYLPSEISDVEINLTNLSFSQYVDQPLYFFNGGEGASEILNNLNGYILRYQEACLGDKIEVGNQSYVVPNGECGGDLPVKDCSNNLIVFMEGNKTSVSNDEGCVFVEGDEVRGSDAFLYEIIGVN